MSDMTVEQKLQLVQQVRSRYHENRYDMSNRERILYGKAAVVPERMRYGESMEGGNPYGGMGQPAGTGLSFFGVRLFVAALLLTAVIVMDRNGVSVAGITTEKIFQVISADYEDKIEEWVEAMAH